MVLIEAQEPRTVALGILLSFYLDFIWFCHISVSGQYCPNYRRVLDQQVKRCEQRSANRIATANIIGAAWHSVLLGEAGERLLHLQAKRGEFVAPIRSFCGFFYVRCASPISGVRIAAPIVLVQHKENERIGEVRITILSASPIVIELA